MNIKQRLLVTTASVALLANIGAQHVSASWQPRSVEEIKASVGSPKSVHDLAEYRVVWGDTLWGLSQATNFAISEFMAVFNIINPDFIQANKTFAQQHYVDFGQNSDTTYTVVNGDTLSVIAKRFHTTVDELVRLNKIKNKDLIFPGQVLVVTGSGQSTSVSTTGKVGAIKPSTQNEVISSQSSTVTTTDNKSPEVSKSEEIVKSEESATPAEEKTPEAVKPTEEVTSAEEKTPEVVKPTEEVTSAEEKTPEVVKPTEEVTPAEEKTPEVVRPKEEKLPDYKPLLVIDDAKITVWYTAHEGNDQSENINPGQYFFDSEDEAMRWITNYARQTSVTGSWGHTSWLVGDN